MAERNTIIIIAVFIFAIVFLLSGVVEGNSDIVRNQYSMLLPWIGDLDMNNYSILNINNLQFTENKIIRTVPIDGGDALLFQSLEIIEAGGFPFIWVAQDSNNDTVVTNWQQNGRNNSFSGQMNSFGVVPKSWVTFPGMPIGNESQGIKFLFNASDYINYCDYLQNNLSLVTNGCQYFADTSGRLVPLLFGGDLEIHRTATVHEGFQGFGFFRNIDGSGSDFDISGSPIHLITDTRQEQVDIGNSSNATFLITFDGRATGTNISPFVRETTNSVQRDWSLRNDGLNWCVENPCLRAKGGNGGELRIMSISQPTINVANISIYFYRAHDNMDAGEFFYVNITDNIGNETNVLTYEGGGGDISPPEIFSYIVPEIYWNKSNVTFRFWHTASGQGEESYVDNFFTSGIIGDSLVVNVTVQDARMEFGDKSCTINVTGTFDNESMHLNCPNVCVNGNCNITGSGGGGGTSDHSLLTNLEFSNSGHTFSLLNQKLDIGSYDLQTDGDVDVTGDTTTTNLNVLEKANIEVTNTSQLLLTNVSGAGDNLASNEDNWSVSGRYFQVMVCVGYVFGGLTGGEHGQIVTFYNSLSIGPGTCTFENEEGVGDQDFINPGNADLVIDSSQETLTYIYLNEGNVGSGGWFLIGDGRG